MAETPDDRDREDLERAVDIVAAMGDGSLLRSVAAVILGFAILTVGSRLASGLVVSVTGVGPGDAPSAGSLAANLGARFLLAVLAGWLTGKAAPRAPLLHAGALAGVLALLSFAAVAGLAAGGGLEEPTWYPTAMLFVGPAGVLAGGLLLARGRGPDRGPRGSTRDPRGPERDPRGSAPDPRAAERRPRSPDGM